PDRAAARPPAPIQPPPARARRGAAGARRLAPGAPAPPPRGPPPPTPAGPGPGTPPPARCKLQRVHEALPQPTRSLLGCLAGGFTRPTFLRIVVLALATILTVGRRTVCNLLRTLGALAPGHPSSYHQVFSRRRWSCWRL